MFEEVVDGRIDDATLTQMLEALRRSLGDPGKLEHEAGARIWSTTASTSRRVHFTIVEHADTTTLRLEERMAGEERLRRAFDEIVALAAARRKVLPGPVSGQNGEDAGDDDRVR